jgi:type IV pilus assembly protein PilA
MTNQKGFTLIELMVVIFIVGILAAVAVPIMRGRIDSEKWSEANASAGSIRTAVRTYIAEKGPAYPNYSEIEGSLSSVNWLLGFGSADLDGAYFYQKDYTISDVNPATATCVVTITSSHPQGPSGAGTLATDGSWTVTHP